MSSGSPRDAYRAFTTTVALITTNGPKGPNVMAAEWTFHVSYDPFLISVHIDPENVTHGEILAAGEFGVNLVAVDQVAGMAFAGHFSKADTDKLSSEAYETYPAEKIGAPMIRGSLLNAECRLVQHVPIGDHTAFIGEVVEFSVDPSKEPLVLHKGSRRLGERILRSPAVVVAATPAHAARGSKIIVAGELTAPERANRALRVEILPPNGGAPLLLDSETDPYGRFELSVSLRADAHPGGYAVRVASGEVEGRARFEVS